MHRFICSWTSVRLSFETHPPVDSDGEVASSICLKNRAEEEAMVGLDNTGTRRVHEEKGIYDSF